MLSEGLLAIVHTLSCVVLIPISLEDSIGMSPLDEYQLAISSFGACIWTLKRSLIENDLLKMKQFEV